MKRTPAFFIFIIILLQVMTWVFPTSSTRPFSPQDQIHGSYQAAFASKQGIDSMGGELAYRSLRALGSRPPNCEHKCGGCLPCFATQTPSTADLVGLQYANYKPEGWKCKCGTSFFNP